MLSASSCHVGPTAPQITRPLDRAPRPDHFAWPLPPAPDRRPRRGIDPTDMLSAPVCDGSGKPAAAISTSVKRPSRSDGERCGIGPACPGVVTEAGRHVGRCRRRAPPRPPPLTLVRRRSRGPPRWRGRPSVRAGPPASTAPTVAAGPQRLHALCTRLERVHREAPSKDRRVRLHAAQVMTIGVPPRPDLVTLSAPENAETSRERIEHCSGPPRRDGTRVSLP